MATNVQVDRMVSMFAPFGRFHVRRHRTFDLVQFLRDRIGRILYTANTALNDFERLFAAYRWTTVGSNVEREIRRICGIPSWNCYWKGKGLANYPK